MSSTTQVARNQALARWGLLGAALLVATITLVEALRFPGILMSPYAAVFYVSVLAVTLIAYAAMAVAMTWSPTSTAAAAFTNAVRWGVVVGVLWWIELLEGNVWRLPGLWLMVSYFGPTLAAVLVPGIAAAVTTRQTGRFRSGLAAGVLSGMIGGLLTFLGGTAILWAFNASFLQDPQNMQEFLRSHAQGRAPDLQSYIVGDLLAGLIAHLSLIGIVASVVVGAIGALVGQAGRGV